jgi:hypothetical protein
MNPINGTVFVEDPGAEDAFNRFQTVPVAGPSFATLQAVTELARQRSAQYRPARQEKPHIIGIVLDEAALAERLIVGKSRSGKNSHPYRLVPRRDTPVTTS